VFSQTRAAVEFFFQNHSKSNSVGSKIGLEVKFALPFPWFCYSAST
jgi:hypothetical protein